MQTLVRRTPAWALIPFLLVTGMGIAGCAGSELVTETRPNSVLSTARSYTLLPPDDFTDQQLLQDAVLRARIDDLLRRQLAGKGLVEQAGTATADLLVRYGVSVQTEVVSAPPIGRPVGGSIGLVPMQAPILVTVDNLPHDVNARDLREGFLVVDVLAPQSRDLLWRATITQTLGAGREKILERTQRALERAFRDLPVMSQ